MRTAIKSGRATNDTFHLPRQVRHGLQLVVDVQLRTHQHEAERVDTAGAGADRPRVPGRVLLIQEGSQGKQGHQRGQQSSQVQGGESTDIQ